MNISRVKLITLLLLCLIFQYLLTNIQNNDAISVNRSNVSITNDNIAITKEIIGKNMMTMSGINSGSSFRCGPGPFYTSDALIIYMIKFHQQTKPCPPLAVSIESLKQLKYLGFNKKAVATYWQEYSGYINIDLY